MRAFPALAGGQAGASQPAAGSAPRCLTYMQARQPAPASADAAGARSKPAGPDLPDRRQPALTYLTYLTGADRRQPALTYLTGADRRQPALTYLTYLTGASRR